MKHGAALDHQLDMKCSCSRGRRRGAATLLSMALLFHALPALADDKPENGPKPATAATRTYLEGFAADLPFADSEDVELSSRGFLAGIPGDKIVDASGKLLRDLDVRGFFAQPAPPTVNPGLWRTAGLLAHSGLFKVSERVYQVRGVDASNMTIILGDKGFIIIDPLMTVESAKASLALVREKLGNRPVMGVIYTHGHVDHFGGAKGVIDEEDAKQRNIPIVAPQGFMREIVSEFVVAGPAMARRGAYQFGLPLSLSATGSVSFGIGPAYQDASGLTSTAGTVSLIAPNRDIIKTGESMTIDGVRVEFQLTPGTEAPAEMNLFFPELHTLCLAENATGTMHYLLPPRGAQVRDAKAWADYLTEALTLYGSRSDILITSHYWPHWGHDKVVDFISSERDSYKFLHDQTVRLMNTGLTGLEIAEQLQLPAPLRNRWFNHGYYGTLKGNVRAIYQRYLGWYDGNPANLDPLPPEEAGRRYVDAMGGADAVLAKARIAFAQGDYRWSAEMLSRLIFASSRNVAARNLLADSLEQLGYQSESASTRNVYLSAVRELRQATSGSATFLSVDKRLRTLSLSAILDTLAVRLVPDRALKNPQRFDLVLADSGESASIDVRDGVLVHQPVDPQTTPPIVLRISRSAFLDALVDGKAGKDVAGNDIALTNGFLSLFEAPPATFGLVTPDR